MTPLNTRIGYDRAAQLAYRAFQEKRPIREVILEVCVQGEGILTEAEVDALLDPWTMAGEASAHP